MKKLDLRLSGLIGLLLWTGTCGMGPGTAHAGGRDPYGNEDPNKKVLKQGLVGAGTGAIAAEASGGKAGKGALIGAGTNVIGSAVLDTLTASPAPAPSSYRTPVVPAAQQAEYQNASAPKKHITRKYDSKGNIIEENEVWE